MTAAAVSGSSARWNAPALSAVEPADGSLAAFLARTDWVVSVDEALHDPGKYPGLQLPRLADGDP